MTKTILAAALIIGTASVAMASEADPNLLNRYPGANMTTINTPVFTSRSVALPTAPVAAPQQSYIDRASQSYGGGY